MTSQGMLEDYARVERAILYLEQNFLEQPDLEQVAAGIHLSKYHFQRIFTRWAGISPKRFLQFLTLNHARTLLEDSRSVLDAALDSGLSGPARLHDLFVAVEAATPGEFKQQGEGMHIRYGWHASPFGECLLAVSDKGVCALSFVAAQGRAAALEDLKSKWARADLHEDAKDTGPIVKRIFFPATTSENGGLSVYLQGTNFQLSVWRALLRIPAGAAASYQDIARHVASPNAVRAVGSAVAHNPVAFLIPCHRVIRKAGGFGNYRWGPTRKKAMLAWEASHSARLAS